MAWCGWQRPDLEPETRDAHERVKYMQAAHQLQAPHKAFHLLTPLDRLFHWSHIEPPRQTS